jgi:putative aminopeptidase FrvX
MRVFDPRVEYAIHSTARDLKKKERNFNYQRQLMSGGVCEATLYVLYGMTVGALAFPLGNYHNMGKRWPAEEIISASDAAHMVDLCVELALNPPVGETRSPMKKRFAAAFKSRGKRLLA